MKLAIIGTHSTGKTTLLVRLKESLGFLGLKSEIVPEMARLCPFPINEETTLEAQKWILENQMAKEAEMFQEGLILLCDRSTIDNLAYFWRAASIRKIDIGDWETRAVHHTSTYNFIFKTQKLSLSSLADGLRATDEYFRQEIDDLITELLQKHRIKYHLLLPTIDYSAQVDYIINRLGLPSKQLPLLAPNLTRNLTSRDDIISTGFPLSRE